MKPVLENSMIPWKKMLVGIMSMDFFFTVLRICALLGC